MQRGVGSASLHGTSHCRGSLVTIRPSKNALHLSRRPAVRGRGRRDLEISLAVWTKIMITVESASGRFGWLAIVTAVVRLSIKTEMFTVRSSLTRKLVSWLTSAVAAVVHRITGSIASTAHAHLSASTLILSSSHGFALDVIQPLRHVLVLMLEGSSLLGSVVWGRRWHARPRVRTGRRGGCESPGPDAMAKGLLVKACRLSWDRLVGA